MILYIFLIWSYGTPHTKHTTYMVALSKYARFILRNFSYLNCNTRLSAHLSPSMAALTIPPA